jgi:hypothetical protein
MENKIKYRVWDKSLNTFVDSLWSINDKGELQCDCYGGDLNQDQYIVQQYTGVNDINGDEIYVGDIVENPNNGHSGEVKFGRVLMEGSGLAYQGFYYGDGYTFDGEVRIIGHIFKNE